MPAEGKAGMKSQRISESPALPQGAAGPSMSAAAELFKAIAHPVRAQILELLSRGESSIPELCEGTGVKPSHLSRHLTQMRGQHLIQCLRSDGRLVYRLEHPEAADLLAVARSLLQARAVASVASVGRAGVSSWSNPRRTPGADPVSRSDGPSQTAFSNEQVSALEATLASRSLIEDACEAIAARSGCSRDAAAWQLIMTANERNLTLREAADAELRKPQEPRRA
ncbi:DNA-binding transcriptional ArsR family regulator [Arthrobacter sp. V1I9]|nr:DNA-binding transcriptional ArsR family regulator [Arthrobacter sp. V1I9]